MATKDALDGPLTLAGHPLRGGELLLRRDIHKAYGGNRQGGISTSGAYKAVFAFTGEAGEAHGYQGEWLPDGTYRYYGEGQRGNMKLTAGGFRGNRRTLFLWEGTTPYLSAAAVDETLRFVARRSAPGSRLIFDYVLRSVLDGRCDFRGAARMKATPEPFTFGIEADAIADYLGARGFDDVRDAGGDDLKTGFPATRRDAYVKPWWRIADASVR